MLTKQYSKTKEDASKKFEGLAIQIKEIDSCDDVIFSFSDAKIKEIINKINNNSKKALSLSGKITRLESYGLEPFICPAI